MSGYLAAFATVGVCIVAPVIASIFGYRASVRNAERRKENQPRRMAHQPQGDRP